MLESLNRGSDKALLDINPSFTFLKIIKSYRDEDYSKIMEYGIYWLILIFHIRYV